MLILLNNNLIQLIVNFLLFIENYLLKNFEKKLQVGEKFFIVNYILLIER